MKKYRSKPVVIEAIQFDGTNHKDCLKVVGDEYDKTLNYPNINTRNGNVRIDEGDWIILDSDGFPYPCKDSVFQKKYKEV